MKINISTDSQGKNIVKTASTINEVYEFVKGKSLVEADTCGLTMLPVDKGLIEFMLERVGCFCIGTSEVDIEFYVIEIFESVTA